MATAPKNDFGVECTSAEFTVPGAYSELSRPAFAVWIRLAGLRERELSHSRKRLASLLGYSEPRARAIFRELVRKGFLVIEPSRGPARPSRIFLVRRALVLEETLV